MRILFLASCSIIGAISAYYVQPFVHKNTDFVLIVVTVFTVFAGFLIAIVTIIGDPIMIPDGSWRTSELGRERMESRLFWHIVLFVLYLLTIALLFVGVVVEKTLNGHDVAKIWIEGSFLFVGISSFFFSFRLPGSLLEMQRARYDAETERRRREVGIGASSGENREA